MQRSGMAQRLCTGDKGRACRKDVINQQDSLVLDEGRICAKSICHVSQPLLFIETYL